MVQATDWRGSGASEQLRRRARVHTSNSVHVGCAQEQGGNTASEVLQLQEERDVGR